MKSDYIIFQIISTICHLDIFKKMIDYLIFAFCFAVFLIIAVLYLYKSSKNITTIPGPEPIDLLEGNLADIKACGSLHQFLLKLHEEYGDIACFWYGSSFCVSLSTPKLFQSFSSAFDKPFVLFNSQIELWGENSIAVSNGIVARKKLGIYSKFFLPELSRKHLLRQSKIIDAAMESWSKWPKGTLLPLHEQIFKITLECFCSSFFGQDIFSVTESKELFNHLKTIWITVETYSIDSRNVDNKMEEQFTSSREYLVKIINLAIKAKKMDSFVNVCQTSIFSEEIFVSDTITYFTDAVFKITSLCSWACYYLSRNLNIQEILRNHIQKLSDKIFDEFEEPEFLKCVLMETMRCAPIVSHTSRYHEFETILNEHKVPEGTPVIHAIGVHFQNPEYFNDPTSFNPNRSELKYQDYSFAPFGFSGRRVCPAKINSIKIASLVLSKIFSRFHLEHSTEEVQKQFGFYTRPANEIWISLKNL